jgi:hypothetical protein
MQWYCVHIELSRIARAVDTTFRKMLIEEHRVKGRPHDAHVYYIRAPGGFYYYFPPAAAEALGVFMHFWEAYACPELTNLNRMEVVV